MNPPKTARNLAVVASVLAERLTVETVAQRFSVHPKTVWEIVHAHCRRVDVGVYASLAANRPWRVYGDSRPHLSALRAHCRAFVPDCPSAGSPS